MKIVLNQDLSGKLKNKLYKENNCFIASDKKWYLIPNEREVVGKYVDEQSSYDIKDWLSDVCEGMDVTVLNKTIYFSEMIDPVMEMIDKNLEEDLYCENWDIKLLDYVKIYIITSFACDLEDDLMELKNKGYDINIIKQAVDNVLN